jgi:hypothetical protein
MPPDAAESGARGFTVRWRNSKIIAKSALTRPPECPEGPQVAQELHCRHLSRRGTQILISASASPKSAAAGSSARPQCSRKPPTLKSHHAGTTLGPLVDPTPPPCPAQRLGPPIASAEAA